VARTNRVIGNNEPSETPHSCKFVPILQSKTCLIQLIEQVASEKVL